MSIGTFASRRSAAFMLLYVMLPAVSAWATSNVSVSKQVTPEMPVAGEPVEFVITVSNAGPDDALDVRLIEQLPPQLQVPAGMGVFFSQGSFDPDTGEWAIGDLAADAIATMTVPAERVGASVPPCVINTVRVQPVAGDAGIENDTASASVRVPGVERCVDLVIENTLFTLPEPFCSEVTSASLSVWVRNRGPDDARDVEITLSQSPLRLPRFGFSDPRCAGDRLQQCSLGVMKAGELRVLSLISDQFNNNSAYTLNLQLMASTQDFDYAESDNQVLVVRTIPVTITPPCDIPLPTGIGSPSCFIATAAWGTPWNKNVLTLRLFRDRWLLKNAPGRTFVAFYYDHSPPLAAYIAEKPFLRAATRAILTPVVMTVRHPILAVAGVAAVAYLFLLIRRRHRRALTADNVSTL